MAYQVVLLVAGTAKHEAEARNAIRAAIEQRVTELGLTAAEVAIQHDVVALDPALPTAAVYISDTSDPTPPASLQQLQRDAVFVVPAVHDLQEFTRLVPAELHAFNGIEMTKVDAIVNRVLEELRLLRRERRVFISYRRAESSGVAEQLRVELERRRYDAFLDTFSVEHGVDFQGALWDQMADTDVVVLLSTATVFDSTWVDQEITRAEKLGIGVVQLIWPGVDRQRDLYLAEPVYLVEAEFAQPSSDASSTLTAAAAERCVVAVERMRARAQLSRRRRVVDELRARAHALGVNATLEGNGLVRLERTSATAATRSSTLAPLVGLPSAIRIEERHIASAATAAILFDALGALATRTQHLNWLNAHLPVKTVAVQGLDEWIKSNLL